MHAWAEGVLVACVVAVTAALVPAILAVRRTMRRLEAVLGIVEQELRPVIGQLHGLTEDVRALTREARDEVAEVRAVTERLTVVADGVGRLVGGLAGLTRVGQVLGLAAGLRRGVDVFVGRLRREQGDHHGE
ncbi:MAG TPA: hypothetical protein VNN07_14805 [Candidatus Tectomicrobia bacterium]|nr:hypothetical protein [Candidatus Tectomicrobia bacterium]